MLTGAGIVGLAVGFGAQTLVRDVISGFFLMLEDQVRVGDVAAINGTGGLVEAAQPAHHRAARRRRHGPRLSERRDHHARQQAKDFSFYVIDLPVSYHEDPDRVVAMLREVGGGLQSDPAYGPFILAPLEVHGLDAFADWWMVMKLRIKTVPLKQWDVGRELRRRIKKAFDAEASRCRPRHSAWSGPAARSGRPGTRRQ